MIRIFLAHASEDKEAVIDLYHRLKERGYQPWLDKEDLLPGQQWQTIISKVIKESDIVIACLSQRSISKRGYVQNEWRMALKEYASRPADSIFLIPLRLDDCNIPDLRQEEYGVNLRDFHWADLFEADGFERLITTLENGFPDSDRQSLETFKPQGFYEALGHGIILDMVRIPGGTFLMGSPEYEPKRYKNEGPQHKVTVPAFFMGRYPVTQAQWKAVAALPELECELNPDPSNFKGADRPVETVSWFDAVEFCQRLSKHTGKEYRLPYEAEWEYSCRAGTTTPYSFGKELKATEANFNGGETTEVGRDPANDLGLHDMHGNVLEWCQDYYGKYDQTPKDESAWVTGNGSAYRVIRGGSWFFYPRACRSAFRFNTRPSIASDDLGFRVSCSAPGLSCPLF